MLKQRKKGKDGNIHSVMTLTTKNIKYTYYLPGFVHVPTTVTQLQ